jgi:two-component system, response regulator
MLDHGVEILLVEDNPNDEMLALHAFKRQKIVNDVFVVRDGVEALEYIFCTGAYAERTAENPKLILLDLKLPKIDGIEVLRRIRSDPRTRLVPVVVLTTSSEDRDIVEAYKLGVNSYIIKPVDFEQFNDVTNRLGFYWLILNQQPSSVNESSPAMTPALVSI